MEHQSKLKHASSSVRHPPVKWAQRLDELYITVELPNAQDVKVTLEPEGKFYFSATAGPEKVPYQVNIDLFDKVDANDSKVRIDSKGIFYLVKKSESKWWDRMLKQPGKPPVFLKVDWDKWVDEDEEQEVDKPGADMDFGDILFHKLNMVGGDGLDDDMTDNDECPLLNLNTLFGKPSQLTEKSKVEEAFQVIKELRNVFKKMKTEGSFNEQELGLAFLNIGLKELTKDENPGKLISSVNRALKDFNTDCHPPLLVPLALYLVGSVNLGLKRFSDSLGYLNRANHILSNMPDDEADGLGYLNKEKVFHAVQLDLAMAHMAVMNHKEALPCFLKVLEIDEKLKGQNSVEVANRRMFLQMVYYDLGEHEKALEQNILAQRTFKSLNLQSDCLRSEMEAANIMIAVGRNDEAVRTLKNVVQHAHEGSQLQVLALISLAKVLYNQEEFGDCKKYLEISLWVLYRREQISPMEVADAYSEIWILYETMNDFESSISLMKRTLALVEKFPEEQYRQGLVSQRIGSMLFRKGEMQEAIPYLESAVKRLECSYGPKHSAMGDIHKKLGAAYSKLGRPESAAKMFAIAKDIMDVSLGSDHADTIAQCLNLSKAYDEMRSSRPPVKSAQRSDELCKTDQDEEQEAVKPGTDMDFGDISLTTLNIGGNGGLDKDVADNDYDENDSEEEVTGEASSGNEPDSKDTVAGNPSVASDPQA